MSWVVDYSQAKPAAQMVLVAIARHADNTGGNAYPSLETLSQQTNTTPRQVKRSIYKLVELGELAFIPQGAPLDELRRDRRPHLYWLSGMPGVRPDSAHVVNKQTLDRYLERVKARDAKHKERGDTHDPPSGENGGTSRVATGGHLGSNGGTSRVERGDTHDPLSVTNNQSLSEEQSTLNETSIEPTESKPEAPTKKTREDLDLANDDARALANQLYKSVKARSPRPPKDDPKLWVLPMARLLRIDGVPFEDASRLIDWVDRDEFWRAQILSAKKFRLQYDSLALRAQSTNGHAPTTAGDYDGMTSTQYLNARAGLTKGTP